MRREKIFLGQTLQRNPQTLLCKGEATICLPWVQGGTGASELIRVINPNVTMFLGLSASKGLVEGVHHWNCRSR